MTPFGIFKRPRKTIAPIEELLGIVPRDQRDSTAPTPAVSRQQLPGISEPSLPSSSGRIAESPNQPASSSIGSNAVKELTRSQTLTREHDDLSRTPAKDKNGRLKSAIWNALLQMSEGANQALRSGRPIDEYALAGVAGRGIGGAGRGAFDPSVDEEHKRQMRMGALEQQIAQQLKTEQVQAQLEQEMAQTDMIQSQTDLNREKPGMEARGIEARAVLAEENRKSKAAERDEDRKFKASENAKDRAHRSALAENNNKFKSNENAKNRGFKSSESAKDRGFKAGESAEDRSIKRSELAEKIYARMVKDKLEGQKLQISIANARTQAQKAGASLNDYIDALSENGVKVVPE